MTLDPTNTRRFTVVGDFPVIVAAFDARRDLFAEVGAINGLPCFVSDPRHYWADELVEL